MTQPLSMIKRASCWGAWWQAAVLCHCCAFGQRMCQKGQAAPSTAKTIGMRCQKEAAHLQAPVVVRLHVDHKARVVQAQAAREGELGGAEERDRDAAERQRAPHARAVLRAACSSQRGMVRENRMDSPDRHASMVASHRGFRVQCLGFRAAMAPGGQTQKTAERMSASVCARLCMPACEPGSAAAAQDSSSSWRRRCPASGGAAVATFYCTSSYRLGGSDHQATQDFQVHGPTT